MIIQGMSGLGDNIHQRAIVRQLMVYEQIWLETPWPSVYHDMVGPRLNLVPKSLKLRTQLKNIQAQSAMFSKASPPPHQAIFKIWYRHQDIKRTGSFLAAMASHCHVEPASFALPIPPQWMRKAQRFLKKWNPQKPIMIYRPLVERSEWNGCASRNPDIDHYHELAQIAAKDFFVISIADLEPGAEWISGHRLNADVEMHNGQLDFETIAALMSVAGLVFCSPGFALILAQAVRAPMVAVFGGHEASRFYMHGFEENLFISPQRPCECFNRLHRCDKRIPIIPAAVKLLEFINAHKKSPINKPAPDQGIFNRRTAHSVF